MPRHSDQSKKIITDIEKSVSLRKQTLNNEAENTDLLQKETTKYAPKTPENWKLLKKKRHPCLSLKLEKYFQ